MMPFLSRLLRPRSGRTPGGGWKAHRRSGRPGVEVLEERALPSCDLRSGVLEVRGTRSDDTIAVFPSADRVVVRVTNTRGFREDCALPARDVFRLVVRGGDGSDFIISDLAVPSEFFGDSGNDTIFGGFGNDTIRGGRGHDDLFGFFGDDDLFGESGEDFLFGEDGSDILDGGYDDGFADRLEGGPGPDIYVHHYYVYFYGSVDFQEELEVGFNPAEGDCKHWHGHGFHGVYAVGHDGTC